MWPVGTPLWGLVEPADRLERGDVIAFMSPDLRLWFHRVHDASGPELLTRGDANRAFDERVPRSAVVGRLAAIAWGPLSWSMPSGGAVADAQRRLGLAWSRPAPLLRRLVRGSVARIRKV